MSDFSWLHRSPGAAQLFSLPRRKAARRHLTDRAFNTRLREALAGSGRGGGHHSLSGARRGRHAVVRQGGRIRPRVSRALPRKPTRRRRAASSWSGRRRRRRRWRCIHSPRSIPAQRLSRHAAHVRDRPAGARRLPGRPIDAGYDLEGPARPASSSSISPSATRKGAPIRNDRSSLRAAWASRAFRAPKATGTSSAASAASRTGTEILGQEE
jgi:hypothetical protein